MLEAGRRRVPQAAHQAFARGGFRGYARGFFLEEINVLDAAAVAAVVLFALIHSWDEVFLVSLQGAKRQNTPMENVPPPLFRTLRDSVTGIRRTPNRSNKPSPRQGLALF